MSQLRMDYGLVEALRVVENELHKRNIVGVSICKDDETYALKGWVMLTTWSGQENEYPIDHKLQPNLYRALDALDALEDEA